MEIRVLRYFLAIASEKNITRAAELLHITQPALSRAMIELEGEIGKALFVREKKQMKLTEEGQLLRKRALEIIQLVEKTESEISSIDDGLEGDIRIGCGESEALDLVVKVIAAFEKQHPNVCYHFFTSTASETMKRLNHGLLDIGVVHGDVDFNSYEVLRMPIYDTWGVLLRTDDALAVKESISAEDLRGAPLIVSRRSINNGELLRWFRCSINQLNIRASYDLLHNAAFLVAEGVGYVLCLDNVANLSCAPGICFRPLSPQLDVPLSIIWKKQQVMIPAVKNFISTLEVYLQSYSQEHYYKF